MGRTMADQTPAAPAPSSPGRLRRARRAFLAWPRPARSASYVAVGLVLALVLGVVTVVTIARRPLPPTDGAVALPGLGSDVEVLRDEHGVPQVWADTTEDLMRAQGWLTASERFFQMDVRRHVAEGRLAELFGPAAVPGDRLARTLGWARVARQELALVEPETRTALAAYAEGVNAYLDQASPTELAVEYPLLDLLGPDGADVQPEPWTETDSLAWLKTVAWEIGGDLDAEVERALTTAAVGEAVVGDLYPGRPVAAPVVDQGAVVDGVFEQDAERGGTRNPLRPPVGPLLAPRTAPGGGEPGLAALRRTARSLDALPSWVAGGDGRGSNAVVVAGGLSSTGAPLLANDPHLDATLPGVWMQVGLHCTEVGPACPYDVAGSSLPGVPGVVVGHNADVAWGLTGLRADVTDLFVERVGDATYRFEGEARPLRVRRERISVAGAADVELEVRSTRHGPLLSDVAEPVAAVGDVASRLDPVVDPAVDHAVAVRWTGLEPTTTADAILALDRATDWASFQAAAARFALPALGLVYADTAGHVGFQATGAVPVRKSGNDGTLPVDGWRSETDWTGRTVPPEGLPSVLDPADGVVVAANQPLTRPGYPYRLAAGADPGYRAARIRRLLDAALAGDGAVSPGELAALQGDDLHPLAARLVPVLLEVDLPAGYDSAGQRLLAGWDGHQPPGSAGAAYFNAVWRSLLERTFHDELPAGLRPDGGARWVAVVARLLDEPGSPWWDDLRTDDVIEQRDDVLRSALLDARDDLTARLAYDAADWEWGRTHLLRLEAASGPLWSSGTVRDLLDRTGPPTGGSGTAVESTDWDAGDPDRPWVVTTAPSMRMVVDLGDLDRSGWVSLAGVSGHPTSAHYVDQLAAWSAGELLAWPFSREAVEAAAEDVLLLRAPG